MCVRSLRVRGWGELSRYFLAERVFQFLIFLLGVALRKQRFVTLKGLLFGSCAPCVWLSVITWDSLLFVE